MITRNKINQNHLRQRDYGRKKRQILHVVSLTKKKDLRIIFFSLPKIRKMFMIVFFSQARNNNSHST